MATNDQKDQGSDTGHVWDGIRELTNDPPKWWTICFYLSLIWVLVYFVLYPSIPLVNGPSSGVLGWTSINEYKDEVKKFDSIRAPYMAKLEKMSMEQILADQEMLNFANAYTNSIFGDNCAACHGAGAQGAPGRFPSLLDDDWLHGGTLEAINETITDGREGNMPAFSGIISDDEIGLLADFVKGLSKGVKGDKAAWALFEETGCSQCHGEDAKGITMFGSANLADSVWRFGNTREDIIHTITYGVTPEGHDGARSAIMPAFNSRLTENDIKLLTVRAWSYGGGQK